MIKTVSVDNTEYVSKSGKGYQFSINTPLNKKVLLLHTDNADYMKLQI